MSGTAPHGAQGVVLARPAEGSLVLRGDVDLTAVEAFDRTVPGDLTWVTVLDVSDVTFIDTQGLGLLLRVAAPRGRPAPEVLPRLVGASPPVRQLLEMLGVQELFDARPQGVPGTPPDAPAA